MRFMSDRADLEDQLRLLSSRFDQLELRVLKLESEQFELVSGEPEERTSAPSASEPAGSQGPVLPIASAVSKGYLPEVLSQPQLTIDPARVVILNSIGQWISGALRQNIFGASGREKLPEPSEIYLVFRGVNGQVYNPVRVFATYPESCRLVKSRGGSFGRSVFIGLPGPEDAKIVCSAAGVDWPSYI